MKNDTNIKVPKKYHHMIEEIYQDSDGYWAVTSEGYYAAGTDPCPGLHTIHEDTHKEILEQIRMIKPCDCDECKNLKNG